MRPVALKHLAELLVTAHQPTTPGRDLADLVIRSSGEFCVMSDDLRTPDCGWRLKMSRIRSLPTGKAARSAVRRSRSLPDY